MLDQHVSNAQHSNQARSPSDLSNIAATVIMPSGGEEARFLMNLRAYLKLQKVSKFRIYQ